MAELDGRPDPGLAFVGEQRAVPSPNLLICAQGYEPRCTHVFESMSFVAGQALVLAFDNRHTSEFERAGERFRSSGVVPLEVGDDEVSETVRSRLEELTAHGLESVAIDVSSFSRLRTAKILEEVYEVASRQRLWLTLYYSPAAYAPPAPPTSPLEILEPVTDSFAGSAADPELPLAALVGLGYEEQRALGVVEFLEAADAWVLVPHGYDHRYDAAVSSANETLLRRFAERRFDYNPGDASTFRSVQSLAHSLRSDFRVVMVPMGPKLLAAACILVSLMSNGLDAVWRASSGRLEEPRPVTAAGPITALKFGPAKG